MAHLGTNLDKNYDRFLLDAVDYGIIWGIVDESGEFAVSPSEEDDEIDVMPFWSSEEYAADVCVDEWSIFTPEAIELDDFIDNWLPGLQKDRILVGINWNKDLDGYEVEPLTLAEDLLETD